MSDQNEEHEDEGHDQDNEPTGFIVGVTKVGPTAIVGPPPDQANTEAKPFIPGSAVPGDVCGGDGPAS